MATIEKRAQFWRVKIRRAGLPAQKRRLPSVSCSSVSLAE
jgi:hypothetical protein